MEIIGNVFALCILLTISIVFFQNKYYLTLASKHFAISLLSTMVYCVFAIIFDEMIKYGMLDLTVAHIFAGINELLLLIASSVTSLYVILKLIDHTYNHHHFINARRLFILMVVALVGLLVYNLFSGFLYTIDADGKYTPASIHYFEYIYISLEVLVVLICAIINRKTVSKSARLSSWQSLLSAIICIILRTIFPSVSFLAFAMSLLLMIFFLNFQSKRIGVNTLTNLNDKRRFFAEIESRYALGDNFNVYLIRLENYELINIVYGHKTGDELLYLFAFRLEKLFDEAVAFHIHSTTFGLVLPSGRDDDKYTEKLLEFIEKEIVCTDHKIKLNCILVSNKCDKPVEVTVLYEQLSHALNKASKNEHTYLAYDPSFGKEMEREKHIINRLQVIDRAHGYEVWFQPVWSVKNQSFSSMEALLRLREPAGGFISPGEFIPVAEKTGLITNVTWFVIDEVFRVLSSSPWLGDMRVTINLSMSNISDDGFVDALIEKARSSNVDISRISFEFTERVIRENLDVAARNMRRIVDEGFSFYLDDFGVGYSNFNCILKLPLKTVKLDMSLTSSSGSPSDGASMVTVLTDLFHDMGLNVVAEGAETRENVDDLIRDGVDGIQGYYFARPMPPEHLRVFLDKNKCLSL